MSEDAAVHFHRPSRTGVEIGLVVSVVGMLLGLSFNAGIQYDRLSNVESRLSSAEVKLSNMHDNAEADKRVTQVSLAKIQTTLGQMQATQNEIRQAIRSKP